MRMTSPIAFAAAALAATLAASPTAAADFSRGEEMRLGFALRPVAACARSAACRKAVAERLRALGARFRERGWEAALHLAELAGEIAAGVQRGYDRVDMCARLDRIERDLAASGRLTPEISRELVLIRTKLGE